MLDGKWTYRSYLNKPILIDGDANAALGLIFGEGIMSFHTLSDKELRGGLAMGGDYAMTLNGRVWDSDSGLGFALQGFGIDGTPTQGWQYDYHGNSAWTWPDGVAQVPCLIGSVIRVLAHGPHAPAGVTASFIAVRDQSGNEPRNLNPASTFL